VIQVVAGIIYRADGRFILARKKSGKPLAGLWEFPGGKCEKDETLEDALLREIKEELGIDILVDSLHTSYEYPINERNISFVFLKANYQGGKIRLCDHDALVWVTAQEAAELNIAPADSMALSMLG
jgi:8-oxo-dGTP diphosphatase